MDRIYFLQYGINYDQNLSGMDYDMKTPEQVWTGNYWGYKKLC